MPNHASSRRNKVRRTGPPDGPASPLIGAQISTSGGFAGVPERAAALDAEVVQVFSSNPRTWQTRVAGQEEMDAFVGGLETYDLPLFFHTIYLINLASPDAQLRRRSAEAVAHALLLGAHAGAAGVVTHVGSHKGEGQEKGRQRAMATIREATSIAADALSVEGGDHPLPPLLLETGVGAGTIIGGRLEELALLLETSVLGTARLGICLDTAHLFAAGYPVHEPAGLDSVVGRLRDLGLLEVLGLIHINDSMAPFASNLDRHENPGDGRIGYRGLTGIVRHEAFTHVPFVLEVPGAQGHGPDNASIAMAKAMRAGKSEAMARRSARPDTAGTTRGRAVPTDTRTMNESAAVSDPKATRKRPVAPIPGPKEPPDPPGEPVRGA